MGHAENTALSAQLEGKVHELDGNLDVSEFRSSAAELRYSLQVDKCDLIKRQVLVPD